MAPTKALLRAAARCNLFYGFSHKFLSHWDRRSCLSFTPVSAHSLLQHQSVIASASGHELGLFVAITKAGWRARDMFPKSVYFALRVLSIRGRPIDRFCEEMGVIFREMKLCFSTKNALGASFLHSCCRAKLQSRLGYSLSKSLIVY